MQVITSGNYLVWNNTEAVTLNLYRNGATDTVSVASALRGSVGWRDNQTLQVLQETADQTWNIPEALLNPSSNGRTIRRGDSITDAQSVVWAVVAVNVREHGGVWHCICKRTGGA